jgi:hypothetical protein
MASEGGTSVILSCLTLIAITAVDELWLQRAGKVLVNMSQSLILLSACFTTSKMSSCRWWVAFQRVQVSGRLLEHQLALNDLFEKSCDHSVRDMPHHIHIEVVDSVGRGASKRLGPRDLVLAVQDLKQVGPSFAGEDHQLSHGSRKHAPRCGNKQRRCHPCRFAFQQTLVGHGDQSGVHLLDLVSELKLPVNLLNGVVGVAALEQHVVAFFTERTQVGLHTATSATSGFACTAA